MQNAGILPSRYGLDQHGIRNIDIAYWNLGTAQLVEHAIRRHEGLLATGGPLVVRTGQFTGRSPKDKFVVRDEITETTVNWGPVNQPISEQKFDALYAKVLAFWQGSELYVQDCFGGADPAYTLPIRVITETAWHSLFARQLFVRPDPRTTDEHVPEFTLMFAPGFHADPGVDGTNSETAHHHQLQEESGPDRRHQLRRRDEEIRLHHSQLHPAGAQRLAHALLGQHRRGWRRGAVLRSFRHRQDDALRRSAPPPDRRRRARLERSRRLQFRRRLLRQVHPPLARERAADLERHPLRHRCSKTWPSIPTRGCSISIRARSPRTRAPPIRSSSSKMP